MPFTATKLGHVHASGATKFHSRLADKKLGREERCHLARPTTYPAPRSRQERVLPPRGAAAAMAFGHPCVRTEQGRKCWPAGEIAGPPISAEDHSEVLVVERHIAALRREAMTMWCEAACVAA